MFNIFSGGFLSGEFLARGFLSGGLCPGGFCLGGFVLIPYTLVRYLQNVNVDTGILCRKIFPHTSIQRVIETFYHTCLQFTVLVKK